MLAESIIRNRRRLLTALAAILAIASPGILNLSLSPDTRAFYDRTDERLIALEQFEQTYLPTNNILFVAAANKPITASPALREAVIWLTARAEQLPNMRRVDSLSTVSLAHDAMGDLRVETYLDYICPSAICIEDRFDVLDRPIVRNRIVSAGGHAAAVIAVLELDRDAATAIRHINTAVEVIRTDFSYAHPSISLSITGGIPMSQALIDAGQKDSLLLFSLAAAAMVVALRIVLGDSRCTAVLLALALSAVTLTMGLAGWSGVVLNSASATIPIVVLTLVVASSMHLFLHFLRLCDDPRGPSFAARAALNANVIPIGLTAATSAASLLSLAFVASPPIRDIGVFSAIGTAAGCALTIFIAPTLLSSAGSTRNSSTNRFLQRVLNQHARSLERERAWALTSGCLFLALSIGVTHLSIDDDFVEYLGDSTTFKKDTMAAMQHLSGPNHIEVDFTTGKLGGIFEPHLLEMLGELTAFLRSQPIVASAASLHDVMIEVADAMSPGVGLGVTTQPELSQYFLAYELSLKAGESAADLVTPSHDKTHVSVLLNAASASAIRDLEKAIYSWERLRDHDDLVQIRVTGENIPVAHLSSSNIPKLMLAIGTSLVLASGLLGLIFRNWKIAASSLAATLAPVACGFGIWGWFNGTIGLAATVVIAVTIGVVVDDAIHLIYRQYQGVARLGQGPWESVAYSVHRVGAPIVSTTVVFILCLCPLLFSDFAVNSTFAACTILILAASMLFDLTALPRLMAWAHSNRRIPA